MEVGYDKAALQEYMDEIGTLGENMCRRQDESLNLYNSCRQQYNRIHTKLEEVVRRAYNQVENAESMRRSAELEYETARRTAENAEDEDERNSAMRRMQQAQMMRASAEEEYSKASIAYSKATGDLKQLSELWNENAPALESQAHLIEDGLSSFSHLVANGNSDLGEYIGIMEKAKDALYSSSAERTDSNSGASATANTTIHSQERQGSQNTTAQGKGVSSAASEAARPNFGENVNAGIVSAASPVGWCASNSMTAVSINECGQKTVSMTIGGIERSYPCTMSGMAKAYRHAKASGDQDMIARTSAMFEIETFREDLELSNGESGFAQLGGYHKDVKEQDPVGYESHHIPSQGTQDEDGKMLPTISMTYDDHKLTSSFAGKQRKTYQPAFPTEIRLTSYKESIIQNLEQGSPGYVDSIKHELLDLRSTTGHRYDGGVSAYLDAVIDMLSTRGIPKAKTGDKK